MRRYHILLFVFVSSAALAVEPGSEFWKYCPGPACPANSQEAVEKPAAGKDIEELNRRELNEMKQSREPRKREKTDRKDAAP